MPMPALSPHRTLLLLVALSGLVACAGTGDAAPMASRGWDDARQAVVVTTAGWNAATGTQRLFEREADGWRQVGEAQPVTIGRAGAAWGLGLHPPVADGPRKKEGDGRSPAGVFAIGPAFGYADGIRSDLPYLPMQATHYCMDVPTSPLYTRIVDAREVGAAAVAGSTEPMRLDIHGNGDQRYRLGYVIEHNAAATPGAGSCIFAHLWKSPDSGTAGCTAMAAATMERTLDWLDPEASPVFVLMPAAEYARLQAPWGLPGIGAQP